MKRYIVLLLLISVTCSFNGFAQGIDNKLAKWSKQNPFEKLYIQTDRENYFAGETVWFKGYFMSEFEPSLSSSTLHIELFNNQSEQVLKKTFPVYAGTVPGQLELPADLPSGQYSLRGYSLLMLHQPGFIFNKTLTVQGKENKDVINNNEAGINIRLAFFPEGGNFITSLPNVVAFKSVDKNGMPIQVEGEVKNSNGEVITEFKSLHDGMGTITLIPEKNEHYYATIKSSDEKFYLPKQTEDGIVFNVTNSSGHKRFKILAGGNNDIFKPAFMIGQMQNRLIFKQPFESGKKEIIGSIKTDDFYSGILHLTVFNKDSMPLAERITFIDNKEYEVPAELSIDTLNNEKRGRNHYTINLKDTVAGDFSISVTDADFESNDKRPTNIYSWFLLSSDIKGYVHQPAYYFNALEAPKNNATELVMMTNGWSRFKWTDIAQNKLPKSLYKDPGNIKLSGKITIEGSQKPLANEDLILFLSPVDSARIINGTSHMFHTDGSGRFEIDSLLFYGNVKMVFSQIKGKKNKFIHVQLDADSLNRTYPVVLKPEPIQDTIIENKALENKMEAAYKNYMQEGGVVLENIIIKSKYKTTMEKLDETYSSGFFSGNTYSRKLDLREVDFSGDIFEYLRERIPGLKISGEPGSYVLNYRGGNLTYYLEEGKVDDGKSIFTDNGNVMLFLNDMPANPATLETIMVNDIALVKLFPTSNAAPGGGAAMVVYTKKGSDTSPSVFSRTDKLIYQGYTIAKEFYNPDYDHHPDSKPDNRLTLSWIPNLFVDGVDAKIPLIFYNNDRTKRFKIVAEGITADGRLLMFEKTIEPRN